MTNPTPNAFLCTVGNLSMHRSSDATAYVLTVTATGEQVGTYKTAKAATDAGFKRIAAAYKATHVTATREEIAWWNGR